MSVCLVAVYLSTHSSGLPIALNYPISPYLYSMLFYVSLPISVLYISAMIVCPCDCVQLLVGQLSHSRANNICLSVSHCIVSLNYLPLSIYRCVCLSVCLFFSLSFSLALILLKHTSLSISSSPSNISFSRRQRNFISLCCSLLPR